MTRLTIEFLGAQGDGIAETARGPVFVPFALPTEEVDAEIVGDRATLVSILKHSPDRVEPACRHFGECGGCAVQHLAEPAYRAWKRDRVVQALASRRIAAEVSGLLPVEPRSRRRAVFSARRTEKGAVLGYNRMSLHEIVDIAECPVVLPAIEAATGSLRALAVLVGGRRDAFHVTATQTASGLDIAVAGAGPMAEPVRRASAAFALGQGYARLSVDGEIVVEPRKPLVAFGPAAVSPPPGAFLQAVATAEEALAGLVAAHLKKARRIVDLFAGAGAFALRLAERTEVHAVEADAAALAALDKGFRGATGLRRVTIEKRDLFRRPLTFKELNGFDGVVIDPPRAGAEDQSKQIARSDVPLVASVSCNPATLARDLAILIDGGYRLTSVIPVDQFLWSPHVEVVALLEKPRRRR